MTDDNLRRRTACHEAGHAVAAVVLGCPVEYASIRRGRTFLGIMVPVGRERPDRDRFNPFLPVSAQPPAFRADVERDIIVSLVGEIAALYLGPRPEPAYRDDPESETIARAALIALGPRLTELVIAREESDEELADDEANTSQLAAALAGPEAGNLYLAWLRIEAQELVRRYGAAILRVADALERHAVLNGDQVAALVFPGVPRDTPIAG